MKSVGPNVPVPEEAAMPSIDMYADLGLERVRPAFMRFDPALKTLDTLKKLPEPESAEPTQPEVIQLVFETPLGPQDLAFDEFVRGAATAAVMLPPEKVETVKNVLLEVGSRVADGGLPPVDEAFRKALGGVEEAIFGNGEPVSWRSLVAYATGAFWLLSFVKNPGKRRGRFTPLEFVEFRTVLSAQLGYTPK